MYNNVSDVLGRQLSPRMHPKHNNIIVSIEWIDALCNAYRDIPSNMVRESAHRPPQSTTYA